MQYRKIILLFLSLLLSVFCVSQTLDELYKKVNQFTQTGDYKNALIFAEQAKNESFEKYGDQNPYYAEALFFLALVNTDAENFTKAEFLFLEALNIQKKTLGNKHIAYVNSLNGLALLYSKMGDYRKAESCFKDVLDINKTILNIKNPDYAQSIYNLADIYDKMGNYNKMDSFYLQAIIVYRKTNELDHPNYLNSLISLAQLYRKTGNYSKAEPLFIEALNIRKKIKGIADPLYAISLNRLALLYDNMGNYSKAEILYMQALDVQKKVLGQEHPEYALTIGNLAVLYASMGNYTKAEPLYIEALEINKKVFGNEHLIYANSLNNLGVFYNNSGKYKMAEPLLIDALDIRKKQLGIQHPDYAISLNNLANLYYGIGAFKKAEPLFIEALNINKKILGNKNPSYVTSLNNLASLYSEMGNFTDAGALYIEALDIRKKVLGTVHPEYLTSLNNLAVHYMDIGNYNLAEELFIEALNIRKKILGVEHPDYATSINNLAVFYDKKGDFKKAEPLYIEALKIRKKNLGLEHPDYALSLNNLAAFYGNMGNFRKAEGLLIESLNLRKRILGKENPAYTKSLNELGSLYSKVENYTKAEELLVEALNIRRTILGIQHPSYCESLNSLGVLYDNMKKYSQAQPLFIEALNTRKKVLGVDHPDYAISLNNLAVLYAKIGDYKKAEPLYNESMNIYKKLLGINNPSYLLSLKNIAGLYEEMGDFYKAESFFTESIRSVNILIQQNFTFLSEQEKQIYFSSISEDFDNFNSFLFKRSSINSLLVTAVYNNELQNKGLILRNAQSINKALKKSNDTALINDWENLLQLKKQLSKIYSSPKDKYPSDVSELEDRAEQLDKSLIRKSQVYNQYQRQFNSTWLDVQKKLKTDEIVVEFTSFHYYSTHWTDSILYCALIIKPGYSQPKFVYLFEEKQLSPILKKDEGVLDNAYINQLYQQRKSCNRLYQLIWQPLDSLLQGVTTVYAAPAGLLHKIALGAIPVNDSNTVSSKYGLQIVGTTADIINKEEDFIDKKSVQQALLFGGINYDIASSKPVDFTSSFTDNIYSYVPADSTRGATGKWNYLNGALTEATEIARQFNEQKITTHFYSDSTATETLFKNMPVNKSSVIHIATHGYFFPDILRKREERLQLIDDKKQTAFRVSENPLLRSGLIFAGANPSWINPDYVSTATDDGILTAYEISNMDLSNVKLVVLSACETGLGDIKGSEGVFGLQRAFKLAGVKNIIMSLWKVPDEKTRELMQSFYQFCFTGKSVNYAFKSAQEMMRVKYPASPFYWAGFTLLQ